MNRRDPLILVAEPELVSSGLWPDRHSAQTPLWEIAQNAQFAGGKVQRRVPNALIHAAAAAPVRWLHQQQNSDGVRWIWSQHGADIYRWYGPAAEHMLGPIAGYQPDHTSTQEPSFYDMLAWGNWTLVNDPLTHAQVYKPETPGFVDMLAGGGPTNVLQYFKKRNQLLAVGHGVNGKLVSFSDADDIFQWVAAPDNLAGTIPLEELNTPARAACHFGPAIAVFGENQMFQVNWVGAPFYYGQQKLLDGIGAVGKAAVCSDGRLVYGVSRNGCWKTDGMQATYIDEVVLRDYLQDNVNWDQRGKIVCRKNDRTGCIEFSFPMGVSTEPSEGWAHDPRYGGWSRVPAFSAMDSRVLLDKPIQGLSTGQVQLVADNPATAGPLLLETKAMLAQRDNAALHIGSLIDEAEFFIHDASGVEFQYGVAEFPDGPFQWTEPAELKREQVTYKLELNLSGTYHKIRVQNFDVNWSLDLQGFALFGVPDGLKREKL